MSKYTTEYLAEAFREALDLDDEITPRIDDNWHEIDAEIKRRIRAFPRLVKVADMALKPVCDPDEDRHIYEIARYERTQELLKLAESCRDAGDLEASP